jgi:hypothetical protein
MRQETEDLGSYETPVAWLLVCQTAAAAAARVSTPSFRRQTRTCCSIVRTLTPRITAISLSRFPSATPMQDLTLACCERLLSREV